MQAQSRSAAANVSRWIAVICHGDNIAPLPASERSAMRGLEAIGNPATVGSHTVTTSALRARVKPVAVICKASFRPLSPASYGKTGADRERLGGCRCRLPEAGASSRASSPHRRKRCDSIPACRTIIAMRPCVSFRLVDDSRSSRLAFSQDRCQVVERGST